jgi:transcriptional regulator with XRE-family HTH domain
MRSLEDIREIRAALARAGLDGAKVARKLGVSRVWVNRVIKGERNRRVEKALVAAGAPKGLFPRKRKKSASETPAPPDKGAKA